MMVSKGFSGDRAVAIIRWNPGRLSKAPRCLSSPNSRATSRPCSSANLRTVSSCAMRECWSFGKPGCRTLPCFGSSQSPGAVFCRCRTGATPRRTVGRRWAWSWPGLLGGCGLWRCLCRSSDGRSDTLERPGLASSIRGQSSQPITEAGGRRAEARLHVPVPVGVQPSAGTVEGAGRRGTLGRNTGGVAASAMAPPARPCMGPFLRFRARGYRRPVEFAHSQGLPQPSPGIRRGAALAVHQLGKVSRGQPPHPRQLGLGHVEQAEQLRYRATVELHPGPPGRCGLHIACPFSSGSDNYTAWGLSPCAWEEANTAPYSGPSARPCVWAFLLPIKNWDGSLEPVCLPGPPTVITNSSDSILPSLAQMAPGRHSP